MAQIDILLSTYNGEEFLAPQLDSIVRQTNPDWRLIIRDDGSTDGTVGIIRDYIRKDARISLLDDPSGNLGPKFSFARLMEHAGAEYMMFCDQDDVWQENKVELSLSRVQELEQEAGADVPVLVFSDYSLVDENLKVLALSGAAHLGFDLCKGALLENLMLQNVIVGNTVMFNRRLCSLALPVPEGAYMHDWWAGLVASAFGRIGSIPVPTVLYRQHTGNVYGIRKVSLRDAFHEKFAGQLQRYQKNQAMSLRQVRAFYKRFAERFADQGRERSKGFAYISGFARLDQMGFWEKWVFILKYYLVFPYPLRVVMDLLFCYKSFGK